VGDWDSFLNSRRRRREKKHQLDIREKKKPKEDFRK